MSADTFARFIVGDSLSVLRSLPDGSVQSVITSPPYLAKRAYLPPEHPDKALEIGQEPTPADFLASLLDWWEIPSHPYPGAHFATYPPALIVRPVVASCPPGGVILDPFAGSGTTLAVAHGHGRSSIGIDLDERNADLARQRVGMWLEVEHHQPAEATA